MNQQEGGEITVTASRRSLLSCRYLRSHVRTLAVVSWAAKMTPMMLSAIWESLRWFRCWSLAPRRIPSNPPPCLLLPLLFAINLLKVSLRSCLACVKQRKNASLYIKRWKAKKETDFIKTKLVCFSLNNNIYWFCTRFETKGLRNICLNFKAMWDWLRT